SALWNPRRWPLLVNPLEPSWGEPYEQIAERMLGSIERARPAAGAAAAACAADSGPLAHCFQPNDAADDHGEE
ncbi:hypothetical protein ACUY22_12170, partial [Corynebacterium tuberculostearicum]